MTLYRLACRVAVALAACATAMLPWVDRTPNNFERGLTILAFAIAAVMVVSIATGMRKLPHVLIEAAAAAATVVFAADGGESLLSAEQRGSSIARTVLFTLAGATISLAVMLDSSRRRRGVEVTP